MRKAKPGEGWENRSCTFSLPSRRVFTLCVPPPALRFRTSPRELVFSTVLGKATPGEEGEAREAEPGGEGR